MTRDMIERQLAEDRNWLLTRPEFMRFVYFEILSGCGIYQRTREEPNVLYLEGRRSLGLDILSRLSPLKGEPHDIIAAAIESGMKLTQGATDERRSNPRPDSE
jgi:hypothetical protein